MNSKIKVGDNDTYVVSKTYEDGLKDAWELARKISAMDVKDFNNVFGYVHFFEVFYYDTPQEVLTKIEAYENYEKSQHILEQIRGGELIQSLMTS